MDKNKIIKFIGKDWFNLLEPAFVKHWDTISEKIKKEKRKITPQLDQIFKCFSECSLKDLSTVVIIKGPYSGLINNKLIADGIALSTTNSIKPPKKLKVLWDIWNDDYNEWSNSTDLTYLANQGVLMLNSNLTTVVGKKDAHSDIWNEFIEDVLKILSFKVTGLHYLIIGRSMLPIIDNINEKLNWVHTLLVVENVTVFTDINKNLKGRNLNEIKWLN